MFLRHACKLLALPVSPPPLSGIDTGAAVAEPLFYSIYSATFPRGVSSSDSTVTKCHILLGGYKVEDECEKSK